MGRSGQGIVRPPTPLPLKKQVGEEKGPGLGELEPQRQHEGGRCTAALPGMAGRTVERHGGSA